MKKCLFCCIVFALFFSLNSYAQPAAARPSVPASAPAASVGTPFLPPKITGTVTLKTPAGVVGQANGLKSGIILVSIDTTIQSNPRNPICDSKMAYLSIDFSNLTGSNFDDIMNGNNLYWVFDKAGKQIAAGDRILKKVNIDMENSSVVNMTVKVPYRLKTDKNFYTIHYRWESRDKQRNIDILTTK